MHINKVELHNFRNYENQEIKLKKNINVFYGDNAQGKTNILEAIFLCTCLLYTSPSPRDS